MYKFPAYYAIYFTCVYIMREVGIRYDVSNGKMTNEFYFIYFRTWWSWANTMLKKNYTEVTEFILLGLTDWADLSLSFLWSSSHLPDHSHRQCKHDFVNQNWLKASDSNVLLPQPPRLYVDLCYATTVTPQMLVHFLCKRKTISFLGCFIQFHFFIALVIADYYMLTVMAYDRYVAICNHCYMAARCPEVSAFLVAAPYSYGFANGLVQTILMLRLSFCGPNEINHFYCADPPLLVLACSDTYVKETAMFVVAGFNLMCSLIIIFISYIFIF